MSPLLCVQDLHYRYPGAHKSSLQGLNLSAQAGRVLGLLGPNGAGKTTLISHLAGLLPIQAGRINFAGQPLASARRSQPTQIALAPQEYAFYPSLSVRENLRCFAGAAGLDRAQAAARMAYALRFTQLEDFASAAAETLSGGLKRRLNLAIALLPAPSLLLLDEPTAGVDPQSRAFLLSAIKDLVGEGLAVIYTSHYMDEIETIADDLLIIDHGQVIDAGTLAEVLAAQGNTLSVRLLGLGGEQVEALLAGFGTCRQEGQHWHVQLSDAAAGVAALAALSEAGAQILSAEVGHQKLEQRFLNLTQRTLRDH